MSSATNLQSSTSHHPFASTYHTPIMVNEIMAGLRVQAGLTYIDATLGGGGHTEAMLQLGARVIGIDQDQQALDFAGHRLDSYRQSGQLKLIHTNFDQIAQQVQLATDQPVMGILMDLGVSSHQLDDLERGFSFSSDNLDMRMNGQFGVTAEELIAKLSVPDLINIFSNLGEERYARRFAQAIDSQRQVKPITSAKQLAQIIYQASPVVYKRGPIHPATRVFQAIRLAVNAELDSLSQALPAATEILADQGVLAVMSFHSLEDRIVKHFMLQHSQLEVVTKKPIMASQPEVDRNPRSRSAKLRFAIKKGIS